MITISEVIEEKRAYSLDMENRKLLAARPEFLFGTSQQWLNKLAEAAMGLLEFDEWRRAQA